MSMKDLGGKVNKLEDTPFGYTMSLIGGKWKMVIIYCILEFDPARYNELFHFIGTISHRILSEQLKELVDDGLVSRKEYPQIPPKVEYQLTERGKSLIPILEDLCQWGIEHRK